MIAVKTWEQTGLYDPTNPNQRIREVYGYPGDGGSFTSVYWNPVTPGATTISSPLGDISTTWAGLPSWGQGLIVAAFAAALGYFGTRSKFGEKHIQPQLKRFGIGK